MFLFVTPSIVREAWSDLSTPLATVSLAMLLTSVFCAPQCSSVDVFCVLTRQCVLYVIHEAESFHRAAYVRDAAVSFIHASFVKRLKFAAPREFYARLTRAPVHYKVRIQSGLAVAKTLSQTN
jgi:hypothetical protein